MKRKQTEENLRRFIWEPDDVNVHPLTPEQQARHDRLQARLDTYKASQRKMKQ